MKESALLSDIHRFEELNELYKKSEEENKILKKVIRNMGIKIIAFETQLKTLKLKQTPSEKLLQNLELIGLNVE